MLEEKLKIDKIKKGTVIDHIDAGYALFILTLTGLDETTNLTRTPDEKDYFSVPAYPSHTNYISLNPRSHKIESPFHSFFHSLFRKQIPSCRFSKFKIFLHRWFLVKIIYFHKIPC